MGGSANHAAANGAKPYTTSVMADSSLVYVPCVLSVGIYTYGQC